MARIKELMEQWQTSLSVQTEKMEALETRLAELTAENPEELARRQALQTEITELRAEVASLTEKLAELPKNVEVENPTPAMPPEISLDPPQPPVAPQTRATQKGWL